MEWKEIVAVLPTLESVQGGNSRAQRGFITCTDGTTLFVKIGIDENTKSWTKKEIVAYDFLSSVAYPYAPHLIASNEDNTGFAIDALPAADGWDWTDTWSLARLDATLLAMDALAAISLEPQYEELFKEGMGMTDKENGWVKLAASVEQQEYLKKTFGDSFTATVLTDLQEHVARSAAFHLKSNALCHHDVRADNCAYSSTENIVKLIDWNWLQMGDRDIDLASFLVHVHQNGIDVNKVQPQRLNREALHWMAGFWFEAASKPIWEGGPTTLRAKQLRSAVTAFSLASL